MIRRSSWSLVFHGDSSHHKICMADINIRSYDKDIKKVLTRDSWCTRGSAGWRSGRTSQPRERWWWSKPSRGETEDQPACKTIPKESWCRCAAALTMGYQLNHVWKNQKAFQKAKPNCTSYHFAISLERIVTGRPFTQESFVPKSLWVAGKHLP